MPTNLHGSEIVEAKFGAWPTFHDGEILTISLDRNGPAIQLEILLNAAGPPVTHRPHPSGSTGHPNYIVRLRFTDIENLELRDFNYQNVIWSLVIDSAIEERFTSDRVEERMII